MKAFVCLYFRTKQRIAHTTNYEPLLDLVGFFGNHTIGQIREARNATYTSEKTIQERVFVTSEKILEDMRQSCHFSLPFDETTDFTVTEQLAAHGCYISSTGELKSFYLKTIDLLQPESLTGY